MHTFTLSHIVFILCASARLCGVVARGDEPQVDRAEILRRGDHIEHVDGLKRGDDAWTQVSGPPADDNHKWFISVIGRKGCAACAALKRDFRRDEHLKAFVTLADGDDNHSDTKTSWAHFNYFDADDKSQAFRWEGIKMKGYPTLLVQPPLNRKWGDPSTVVCQITGYDGDGKKLAQGLAAAIKAYVEKQSQRHAALRDQGSGVRGQGRIVRRSGHRQAVDDSSLTPQTSHLIGIDPPWAPVPKVDPPVGPLPAPHGPPDNILPPLFDWPPRPDKKPDPRPLTPDPSAIPATPEAVVVVDGSVLSGDEHAKLTPLLERLKRERPGLRVRLKDVRELPACYNVRQQDVPAIVLTSDGQVDEKLTGRLLPLFAPKPAVEPATHPPVQVTVPPFPLEQWLAALASGGSVASLITAGIATFLWFRARRRASGAAVIAPQVDEQQLAVVINAVVQRLLPLLQPKQPPANP